MEEQKQPRRKLPVYAEKRAEIKPESQKSMKDYFEYSKRNPQYQTQTFPLNQVNHNSNKNLEIQYYTRQWSLSSFLSTYKRSRGLGETE
ncbi:hypothetical protein OXYTRIMIC_649 [Oxytricha trifallax]|uniref:Uncharacterized protein n=1 Tax=Oxytricha trifallax TaxID=1172189 RepID=A0A073HYS1_9SPIT|nr:hypothetical protein OXYTRIMIC_649 [Oxytricha trifallax]